MVTWIESDVVANGIRLHCYRTGADLPPVVLVHGITDNGLCWPNVAEALAPYYEVISYDARCHGQSEVPRQAPIWEDLADDLAALIGVLGLKKPYALGHSMGGATVAIAAAKYPDLLGKAALSDPALGDGSHDPVQAAARRDAWRAQVIERKMLSLDEIMAAGRQESPLWPDNAFEPWALAKQQVDPSAIDLVGSEIPEWRALCQGIICPTLLLWADNDRGSIVSQKVADEMMTLLVKGKQAHFKAGHNIRRDQPQPYIEAVLSFFAS